jgi:hypothetical protein
MDNSNIFNLSQIHKMQAQLLHHTVHPILLTCTRRIKSRLNCYHFGGGIQYVDGDYLWRQDVALEARFIGIIVGLDSVVSYKHTLKFPSRYKKLWNDWVIYSL